MTTQLAFLAAFLLRHQLWEHAPVNVAAQVWNLAGAAAFLFLLAYIGVRERSLAMWAIIELWAYEELLVLVCGTWRLLDWWPVPPGEGQCSAKVGFRLTIMSTVVVGIIALHLLDELSREKENGPPTRMDE